MTGVTIDLDEVSSAIEDTTVILEGVSNINTNQEVVEFHSNNSIRGLICQENWLFSHFVTSLSPLCILMQPNYHVCMCVNATVHHYT